MGDFDRKQNLFLSFYTATLQDEFHKDSELFLLKKLQERCVRLRRPKKFCGRKYTDGIDQFFVL